MCLSDVISTLSGRERGSEFDREWGVNMKPVYGECLVRVAKFLYYVPLILFSAHTKVDIFTHTVARTYTHLRIHSQSHTHTKAYTHMHTNTLHTHTHTFIYSLILNSLSLSLSLKVEEEKFEVQHSLFDDVSDVVENYHVRVCAYVHVYVCVVCVCECFSMLSN